MQKKNWGEKMQDNKQTMGQIEEEIKKFRKLLETYLETADGEHIKELINCMDSGWSLDEAQHDKLIDMFVNYNDKLYRDAVSDAYNRRYYEDELKEIEEGWVNATDRKDVRKDVHSTTDGLLSFSTFLFSKYQRLVK